MTLTKQGESIIVDNLTITVGDEYEYMDQFVLVREIQGAGRTRSGTEQCVIENRWGTISTCDSSELSAKPARRPLTKS